MLLCFHGSDSYRLDQAISDLIAVRREKHGSSLLVIRVDCDDDRAADDLERHLKYPSFFGDTKLIVAKNAAGEALTQVMKHCSIADIDDVILVALQDTSRTGFDKKALRTIETAAQKTTVCEPLIGAKLVSWIGEYCGHRGTTILPDAATLLVRRNGSDTRRLVLTMDTCIAYAQGTPIDTATVTLLTSAPAERDEWELSNAMASHDKRSTVAALWRKLQEGTPEQLLVGSIAGGLRNLIMVKDLVGRHQPVATIAKHTGLHPFVISKTMRGAGAADAGRLIRAHLELARLDRQAKNGTADTVDGLFSILLSL